MLCTCSPPAASRPRDDPSDRSVQPDNPARRTCGAFFVPRGASMPIETHEPVPLPDVQRELERQLEERLAVLQELEPFALPSVDPVAYQSAASHRIAIEQITAALNRITLGTY